MGRPKGSKNKPKVLTDNSVPLISPEKKSYKASTKKDGFKHGPCGKFWPLDEPSCPHCVAQ